MATLKTKVYTTRDLQAPEANHVLIKVVELINSVYCLHEDFLDEIRFDEPSDLWDALGDHGMCAVLYDDENPNGLNIVATASARPCSHQEIYHGHKLHENGASITSDSEYEIFSVACQIDPQYAQKGLAMETTKAVIAALPCFNGLRALTETTLWVKVADHNKPYWQRRGFTVTKSQPVKAGFWGCRKDFTIWTMKKEFENPNL